jgi:hypothetical protein
MPVKTGALLGMGVATSAALLLIGTVLAGKTMARSYYTGCAPKATLIFAQSRRAEVYERVAQPVFGCVVGFGRRVQLGIGEECAPVPKGCPQGVVPGGSRPVTSCRRAADLGCGVIASVALGANIVAYDEFRNEGARQEVHFMSVRSLPNGHVLHHFRLGTNEDVQEIVVTRTGATAWVEFNREPGCFSFGHDGNRCYGTFSIYTVGASGFRALAVNLTTEPTLTLAGDHLTWVLAGQQSSTMLV